MEDFHQERQEFVAKVLRFLEVDDTVVLEPKRQNDSSVLPSTHLFDLKVGRIADRVPGGGIAKKVWGRGPSKIYRNTIGNLAPPLSDKSIEPALKEKLVDEYKDEVTALGSLISRDLEHWNQ
ncbi:hypothetical protein OAF27_02930 [Verrucomicrobiales bacterium]|nr:hypothetical protein [Verrucomicrobiales bacterium]